MIGIGFIRLALALTVVITHTHLIYGFSLGSPVIAVRTFFIISGFYMSLVLNEKYHDYKLFITNRFLKIYPIYLVILLMTVLSCIGAYLIRNNWGELADIVNNLKTMTPFTFFIILVSHFTIIGRSLVMFSGFNQSLGAFVFPASFPNLVSGINFLLVPQAWTLVIELWFYLVAPFIVKKGFKTIIILFTLSVLIKEWLKEFGFVEDVWTYRFFPTELAYFLMGWVSYKIYKLLKQTTITKVLGAVSVFIIISMLSLFNYIKMNTFIEEWIFYSTLMALIPLTFMYSQKSRLDRWIGNLSYPVYITHILVNNIVNPLMMVTYIPNRNLQAPIVFGFSIILSLILNRFIQSPIEKFREARIKS